jgi:hypothetical protein
MSALLARALRAANAGASGAIGGVVGALPDLGVNVANLGRAAYGFGGHQLGLLNASQMPEPIDASSVPLTSEWISKQMGVGDSPEEQIAQFAGGFLSPGGKKAPGRMKIVPPDEAKKLKFEPKLPDSPTFTEAVSNTPGARVDPEGLFMRVQRNQQPEQAMSESVRGGVFYLPEGASQAKHYGTGKIGYGGPDRIKGETLVRNPLFTKGATGGRAPATAYDSLLGKGAYERMRGEALQVRGYTGRADEAKRAEEFLAKYAPELSGMSDHILENSKFGNTLGYALQEAAVASAVRNAGHDAVLGYSKGKKGQGHFLSELFDVRESHYPNEHGAFRVWDDLYK